MAYRIHSFDGMLLPEYLQDGDTQNMGTGDALTAYLQLPGGGWYDQYRDDKSPQGVRPISKTCILWGDTQAELRENLDDLRGKIGKAGRLVALYDDEEVRWQWARLRRVDAPRPERAKANWLPVRLEWETAAQWWYGLIWGDDWVVGDLSFLIGDGTAELGQNEVEFVALASDGTALPLAVTHGGNIHARNLLIEISKNGTPSSYTIWNRTTGQYLSISPTYTYGTVYINAGSREVYEVNHASPNTIDTIYGQGNALYVTTAAAHGLSTNNDVRISGTENYDGLYRDITVSDATHFSCDVDPKRLLSGVEENEGTIEVFSDRYAALTAHDKTYWMSLAPGLNTVEFSHVNLGAWTLRFRFYDHYA